MFVHVYIGALNAIKQTRTWDFGNLGFANSANQGNEDGIRGVAKGGKGGRFPPIF